MEAAQEAEREANEETVQAINDEIDSKPEELQESVNRDTPPPPAVTPQPVAAEEQTFNIGPPPAEPAEPAEPEVDERGQFADQMLDTAGYKPGGSRKKAREVALGLYDKPESYEAITSATGSRGFRGKLAEAVAAYHGMTPAQADATVQSAEQGNPAAKQKVEEATDDEQMQTMFKLPDAAGSGDDDEGSSAAPLALFSSDEHIASWDALLKGLNIR